MKKYKLLKDLPWADKWDIYREDWYNLSKDGSDDLIRGWIFEDKNFKDLIWVWVEEIKEEKEVKYRVWDYAVVKNPVGYLKIDSVEEVGWGYWYNGYEDTELRLPTNEELEKYFR